MPDLAAYPDKYMKTKNIAIALVGFALIISFNVWLNSGCKLSGVITTHGKVCVD